MDSKSKWCTCEGNNSNCFRCAGSGIVQLQEIRLKRSNAYNTGQILFSKRKKLKKTFPVIFEQIKTAKKITIEFVNKPPQPKKNKKPVVKAKSPFKSIKNHIRPDVYVIPNNIECPICCSYVSKTLLAFSNHLETHDVADKKKHQKLINLTINIIDKVPPVIRPYAYMQKQHLNLEPKEVYISRNHTSKSKQSTEPTRNKIVVTEYTSKKLDKTFGEHTIRDAGQFGSYPSHDNFDDESGA